MGGQKSGRILVTGALSQIGMELLDALINKFSPENVIATDIEPEDMGDLGFKFVKLDVLNRDNIEKIILEHNVTEVYHLAAILSATGEKNPELC